MIGQLGLWIGLLEVLSAFLSLTGIQGRDVFMCFHVIFVNALAALTMYQWLFRIPLALSSILAALGLLQPRTIRILNCVDPLVSPSNSW